MLQSKSSQNGNSDKAVRLAFLALALGLVISACTKKRPETFVQGQGENLLKISDFDGAEFEVKTLKKIMDFKEVQPTTKSEKITGDILSFGAVKIDPKAELVGDTPFIALEDKATGYKVRYRVNDDYLVVLKVAAPELLHPSEIPGAIKVDGSNELEVPLLGYPIRGFYRIENVQQNGDKSDKLIEIPASDKSKSIFFRIDRNAKVIYKIQDKMDLFKPEYFVGKDKSAEWYYGETVIGTSIEDAMFQGWVLSQADGEGNGLSKIKFFANRTELKAVSINLDKRIDIKEDSNQKILVSIPIEWKEFRPASYDKTQGKKSKIGMQEEDLQSVEWSERGYIKVHFEKTTSEMFGNEPARFVDLEVTENYFSYAVYFPERKIRIKYAFLRDVDREKYTPKQSFKADQERFGFFTTKKHEFDNFEKFKKADFGKNEFINRFNTKTKDKKIKFYLAAGADTSMNDDITNACKAWTKAFNDAGVDVTVEFDKSKQVQLGDIRYNIINLIKTANETDLFGYGPSITDPRTGEIISATTNVHLTTIQSALASYIREFIYHESGISAAATVLPEEYLNTNTIATHKGKVYYVPGSSGQAPPFSKLPVLNAANQIEMLPIEKVPTDSDREENFAKKSVKRNAKLWGREFSLAITGKYLNEEIQEKCGNILDLSKKKSERLKAKQDLNSSDDKENEMVIECSKKLLPIKMMGTLLHEMGHNFGLLHNFAGSADKENFLPKEQTGTKDQVKSSSVMEYPSFSDDRLNVVGLYDIEALRFGYGDAVQTSSGNIEGLDTSKSIEDNISKKGVTLKKFKYCTDDHVALDEDPMCARYDSGSTPAEVVFQKIHEYNASIAQYNYRFDRNFGVEPSRLTYSRANRFWRPLKRFYDEWRFKVSDLLGPGNEYLDNYDQKSFDEAIRAKKDSDPEFASYFQASRLIFDFAFRMAQLPARMCLGERNGTLAAVEFSELRKKVIAKYKTVPLTCQDPHVIEILKAESNFVPTLTAGYELDDVRFDMKIKPGGKVDWWGNPIPEPPDIIGLSPEKMTAVSFITARLNMSRKYEETGFKPNLMDEPEFRDKMLTYVGDRLANGISAQTLFSNNKESVDKKGVEFFEKFKQEKKFIDYLVEASLREGLAVPERDVETRRRKGKYEIRFTDQEEKLKKAKYKVAGPSGLSQYAITSDDATEALKLLKKMESLPPRISAAVPLSDDTFKNLIEFSKLALSENDEKISIKSFFGFVKFIIEDELTTLPRTPSQKLEDLQRVHWKRLFAKEVAMLGEEFKGVYNTEGATMSDGSGPLGYAAFAYEGSCKILADGELTQIQRDSLKNRKDVCDTMKDPSYRLNRKTLMDRIQVYVTENKAAVAANGKTEDQYNIMDLQSQLELIQSILRQMSWQFND